MLRRRGRFRISGHFLRKNPEQVIEIIMSRVLVTGSQFDLLTDVMDYTGISDLFDVAPDAGLAPFYEFTLERKAGEKPRLIRVERRHGQ